MFTGHVVVLVEANFFVCEVSVQPVSRRDLTTTDVLPVQRDTRENTVKGKTDNEGSLEIN